MKTRFIYIFLMVGLLCSCSTRTQQRNKSARLPLLRIQPDKAAVAAFEQADVSSQPWLGGNHEPPVSIAGLGLQGEVRLLINDFYFDGGSHKFVLSDEAGHYFVFCTSNPEADEQAFLLGTKHFTEPAICRVPIGTASYQFLFDLIWSFAENPRYRISPEELEHLRIEHGLSKQEFDQLFQKPLIQRSATP